MQSIDTGHYNIHFNTNCYKELNTFISKSNFSKVFILVDSNTHEACLPKFMSGLETNLVIEIIEIENGEISLIKWQIATTDDGNLKIVRVLLEGPQKLIDYKTE